MKSVRFVLGDQLSRSISSLRDIDSSTDIVLMTEVRDETTYVPHHKQKIALILSAMRHFADELINEGIEVDYVRLTDGGNTHSFADELGRAIERHDADAIVITEPGEYRVMRDVESWEQRFGVPVDIRPDTRYFASRTRFAEWVAGRKSLRMEHFYREMRRETGLLMHGGEPEGNRWNFDADNRKRLPTGHRLPRRRRYQPDMITQDVLALVEAQFGAHFGDAEPFGWPVTRADALSALEDFIAVHLPQFGDFQDAMKSGEAFVHHALLAPALNIGLLTAREVCHRAEQAYRDGLAPLNAVEGFVRQILGWREYVRGIYWLAMPDYRETNALAAKRSLPSFYWSGQTAMHCVAEVVGQTQKHAYAHHIQRLMVTGNFALLAGVAPAEVESWYLAVYADAFEWVELPNTHGMVLFADGGLLASKPYAASGAYINRMSDYCSGCAYDVSEKSGPKACPFNYLYWAFLMRNEAELSGNPRMAMPYRTLNKWPADRKETILHDADAFLDELQ